MKSVIDYLMNPEFSDSVTEFFLGFGNSGIVLLGTIKMIIIFVGSVIMVAPFIPLIVWAANKYCAPYISDHEKQDEEVLDKEIVRNTDKLVG
jgi:hypothetical protein